MHKLFIAKRVKEVEKKLRDWPYDEDDFIYRSYHGSYKICWIRFQALWCLNTCLYILGAVDKLSDSEEEMLKLIEPCICSEVKTKGWNRATLTQSVFEECAKNDFISQQKEQAEKENRHVGWYNIGNHIIPYLGYYSFFKIILDCLLRYARERTGKEPYGRLIEEWEGTAEYFISDIISKKFIKRRELLKQSCNKRGKTSSSKNIKKGD